MLTYQECLDMSGLTEDEIEAIAEHERMDPMIAAALGQYLIVKDDEARIRTIILDDIKKAEKGGNEAHAEALRKVLKHFLATHPDRKD
ncbi:hypothetical protein GCM10011348_04660 [Marinobacterium nitratireducens]|uniref:Uncharacterized protein n=1 Tax=Marinobacterium nitratireducens TaxID=518897 RepID=A0A918DPC0_9GAMM|nr:hypothetical protein [Marinobacterium nitratireducens]GGO76739.1 hypothetical protein GCM10011348_04660 [Marinobacterium nitratireducens]